MGYDLPAAIGAAIAAPDQRIICIAGDGSIMMNIQDMITVKNYNLNILIFILENDGYLSIKQTQNNFFGVEHGSTKSSGLTFPNFTICPKLVTSSTVSWTKNHITTNWIIYFASTHLLKLLRCHATCSKNSNLASNHGRKVIEFSLRVDDMFPPLDRKELEYIRTSCLSI